MPVRLFGGLVSESIVIPQLTPNSEFSVPASRERLERAQEALRRVNIETEIVSDSDAARDRVLELVPEGSEVHIGLSETMRELGVTRFIEESGKYGAIRPQLLKLDRTTQRREMAKLATAPDYMLGSVHAVTEEGELVVGSGTGSQLAPYANGAGQVILVAGAQKVVTNLEHGLAPPARIQLPARRCPHEGRWAPRHHPRQDADHLV